MSVKPISINFVWKDNSSHWEVPSHIANFLFDDGSLTRLLKSKTDRFSVKVINEQTLYVDEPVSKLMQSEYVRVREVLLNCNTTAVVYAQSWINQAANTLSMQLLGEQPLGDLLFQDETWQRSELQFAQVEHNTALYTQLNVIKPSNMPVFARRRMFTKGDAKVMVCELFIQEVTCEAQ